MLGKIYFKFTNFNTLIPISYFSKNYSTKKITNKVNWINCSKVQYERGGFMIAEYKEKNKNKNEPRYNLNHESNIGSKKKNILDVVTNSKKIIPLSKNSSSNMMSSHIYNNVDNEDYEQYKKDIFLL